MLEGPADLHRYTRAHLQETFDMFLLPDREALGSYRSFLNSSAPSPAKPERFILRGLRTVEGKLIGNLFGSIVPASDEAEGVQKRESWELGYDLDPDYWGKGLGKRMIGFEVNWAGWLGIDTLVAVSLPFTDGRIANDSESFNS